MRRHLDANYAFPIHIGKGDAHCECILQSGTEKVAVQGIRIVALAPNDRHYEAVDEIRVPFLLLALLAVAAFCVVAAAVAVSVHQQLQSDQIGFILLTSWCQEELSALMASQQKMMWKM